MKTYRTAAPDKARIRLEEGVDGLLDALDRFRKRWRLVKRVLHFRLELLGEESEHLDMKHEALRLLVDLSGGQRFVAKSAQNDSESLRIVAVLLDHGMASDDPVLLSGVVIDLGEAWKEHVP